MPSIDGTRRLAPHAAAAALTCFALANFSGADPIFPFPAYPGTQPSKVADRSVVLAGGDIEWTITIFNDDGGGSTDYEASLWDDVPDSLDSPALGPFALADITLLPPGAIPTYSGDALTVSRMTPAKGGTSVIKFLTHTLASATDGTVICNQGWVRIVTSDCGGFPPLCTENTYDSGTRPGVEVNPTPTCVTIRRPSAAAQVISQLGSTSTVDSCPQDPGFPAPDARIAPGETLSLTLGLQNFGGRNATASPVPITGILRPGTGYTIVAGSSGYTTTVSPNNLLALSANVGTNSTPYMIRVDPGFACPGTLRLTLDVTQITDGPFAVTYDFPVTSCNPRCAAVSLTPEVESVRDACTFTPPGINGAIDPGDDVYLVLPVRNAGPDSLGGAPTIVGTLTSLTTDVTVLPSNATSNYPNLPALGTASNVTEFAIHLADSLACGTPIDLRVTLATDAGPRVVDFHLTVADPCVICSDAVCLPKPAAVANGSTEFCAGGSVTLDAGGSTLTGCAVSAAYQWYASGLPISGATARTYDTPTTLPAGTYGYNVEVSCPTDPGCAAFSSFVIVRVLPTPLVVNLLMGVKTGDDADFSWTREDTALGGYRLYRTGDKRLVDTARLGAPGVTEVGVTAPDPADTFLIDVGVVPGLPTNPDLYFYQTLALCTDRDIEGPN